MTECATSCLVRGVGEEGSHEPLRDPGIAIMGAETRPLGHQRRERRSA